MASPTTTDGTGRVGQVLGGRYRLLSPVGRGASGQVFVADDVVLRRRVAVKVLHTALAGDEVFLRRFRAEAQAAAALNHPHVMAVYDWGHDEEPYLVTEYLAGGSLRAMLDGGRTLSLAQTVHVGLEAARGLEYAHRRGFIHRDIKPANLLFDDEARLRIADFGLARALAEAAWTEPTGAVLGTARYASPEQARGETLDGRSDVYSLALVMVEAGTGSVPFTSDTALGTLMARVGQPMPVDPALGPLCDALEAAGAAEPADRPGAATFVDMLMAVADQLGRPEPLPLAGTGLRGRTDHVAGGGRAGTDTDPTSVAEGALVAGGLALLDESSGATPLARPTRADRKRSRRAAKAAAKAERRPDRAPLEAPPAADGRVVARVTPASTSLEGGTIVLRSAELAELDDDGAVGPVALFDQDAYDTDHGADPPDRRRRRSTRGGEPRRRRMPFVLMVLALVAALGAGVVVWQTRTELAVAEVADYRGATIEEVAGDIRAAGWVIEQVDEYADATAVGEIIAQSPPPGTELGEGETIILTVSLGPPPVAVPTDLAGLTVEDATARLAEVGLGVETTTTAFDEVVPPGSVVGLAEGTPAELPKGAPVPLVVSDGPAPRAVPDVAGLTLEQATADLGGVGLLAVEQQQYSDVVDEGLVIATDPGRDTMVPRDSEVTVKVSLGPELIAITGVAGLSVSEAAAAIEAQDLCVSGTQGSPTKPATGTIPAKGTEVKPGTCVTITTN